MARKSRKNMVPIEDSNLHEETELYQVAAYLRLSADDTHKQGDSLETQKSIIQRHIATSPDLRLVDCYTDNDKTGTNFNRSGFQQMMTDVEAGKINCIVVKDLSRFGRNAIDAGYYLEKYLPSKGVRFIAVNDGYDSLDGDGGIMLPIKNILAESYALDIGRKCKAVKWKNIEDGYFIGNHAPYGYQKDPADCHKLVVDDQVAPTVRKIFQWALDGIAPPEITRRLNETKIPTPSMYKTKCGIALNCSQLGGTYWTRRTVIELLNDRVYIGDMVQGKTIVTPTGRKKRPPEEWVIVRGTHTPLIPAATYFRIQEMQIYTAKCDKHRKSKSVPHSPNLFKGLVVCAHCGYTMIRTRQSSDGTYWFRCQSQSNYGKHTCSVVSIKEQDILNVLMVMIHQQNRLMSGRYQGLIWQSTVGTEDADLQLARKEIAQTKRFIQSLYENLVSDVITPEEYTQMKADYAEKLKELTQKAGDLQETKEKRQQDIEIYETLTEAVTKTLENRTLTAFLVEQLVERIEVLPDKTATIYLKYRNKLQEAG